MPNLMAIINTTAWLVLIRLSLLIMYLIYRTLTDGLWTLDRMSTSSTPNYGDGPTHDTVHLINYCTLAHSQSLLANGAMLSF
jgi:hypothetical protein